MPSLMQSPADLLEAWGDIVPPYDADWAGDGFGMGGLLARYQRAATTLHDRADGRFLPVFQTEFDLAVIRSLGRTLAAMAPGLVGGLRNLCNYTIGEGYSFTVSKDPLGQSVGDIGPLIKAVQAEISRLLDDNDFISGFDREIHDTSIIDGESFLRLIVEDDAIRIVRCEPDQIRQPADTRELEGWIQDQYEIPCDDFVSSWSFGVHTRADRPDTPLGFHFVADEGGVNWEYVPADQMVQIKRNVTRNAKRGFSDFYPIEQDSVRGEKLRRNMAEGAAIQSAIAFVRQHVAGTTRTGVEQLLGDNKSSTQPAGPGGSRLRNVVQYRPGTVVDLSAGLEYKPGPLGSERASDFLLVAAYVQRMQAVRWSMPEYMFSGDASNANYASTMEATAPFVKSCEAEQRFYSRHFVTLLWKALKLRWQAGAFDHLDVSWESLASWLKIQAECPEVATRDELQNVQRQETLIRLGILSRRTAAAQNGLDYDAEVANGAVAEGASPDAGVPTGGTLAADTPPETQLEAIGPARRAATLFECGGKGGKPGPCPKNRARPPSKGRRRGQPGIADATGPDDSDHNRNDAPARAARTSGQAAANKTDVQAGPRPEPTSPRQAALIDHSKPNGKDRQDYARNVQHQTAQGMAAVEVEDNAPADLRIQTVRNGQLAIVLIEHKTLLDRRTDDIKVSRAAFDRKAKVTAQTGHEFFTIATDERDRFEGGTEKARFKNRYYVKLGAYSGSLSEMFAVDSLEEVRRIALMSVDDLIADEKYAKALPTREWTQRVEAARAWKKKGSLKSHQARVAQDKANQYT